MRVLALFSAAICGLGCSAVLGLEDPTPGFGDGGLRTLRSITIGPDPLALPLGISQQLTATGTFDDGSVGDITTQTEFSIMTGGALTVTSTGLAQAISEGPATVTAKIGKIEGHAVAMVGPAVPARVVFGIGDFRMARLQSVRLRVLAVLTDGTMQDATANATYESDNPAVAIIGAPGRIDGGSQSGMATITASLGGASPGTVQATVTPKSCGPVINEFQTGGISGSDEWIEILNPCTGAIDVDGWTLVYRAASASTGSDSNLMMALTGQLAPGELRLYAGQDFPGVNDGKWPGDSGIMQQNNGGIALRSGPLSTGPLVDSVAYGAVAAGHPFIEGLAALPAMVNGRSAQRLPFDGRDDDDGAVDFMQVLTPTPRAPNAP